jgi:hypothetical protein
MLVNNLNTTGRDYYIYNGLNEQRLAVGSFRPAFIDFKALDGLRVEHHPFRECKCECGDEEMKGKRGVLKELPAFDLYLSDYLWLQCNFSCPYCLTDSPEWTAKSKFLVAVEDRLALLKILSDGLGDKRYFYRMFGGEPTVYPGFDQVVNFVNDDPKCVISNISTNAHVWERLELFLEDRMSKDKFTFNISVHPADPKFDWGSTKRNVLRLYDAGYYIFMIGVDTHLTRAALERYSAELADEIGIGIAIFENLRPEKPLEV